MEIESRLLQQARTGDRDAMNQLIAVHRDELLAMAQGKLGMRVQSRIDASDVVQQTCLSVFRQINQFGGTDVPQFVAWVRQIHEHNIQNAVQEHVRVEKRNVERERSLDEGMLEQRPQPTASENAMRREESHRLVAALAELPPEERVILEMRYLDGRTLQDIAHETNLTKEAVIWRMQKGMQRVRAIMARSNG